MCIRDRLYTSLSIATELAMGSMWFISTMNERLPKEGAQALLASMAIALAAPCVLVLALMVVSLWLGTLPGGLYILQFYIFKGVNIGSAQLNLAQVLLIITAFFLARTASSMGAASVSYTHLDVYKRQPSRRTGRAVPSPAIPYRRRTRAHGYP